MKMRLPRSLTLAVLLGSAALFTRSESLAQAPPAACVPAPKPTAETAAVTQAVVDQVQAFYNKTSTFQTPFQQEYTVKAYNQKKTSRGRVTFAKPGKMDWAYDDPAGN